MMVPTADAAIEDRPEQSIVSYLGVKRVNETCYHDLINAGALDNVGGNLGATLRCVPDDVSKSGCQD
jgi:hypothetical protein